MTMKDQTWQEHRREVIVEQYALPPVSRTDGEQIEYEHGCQDGYDKGLAEGRLIGYEEGYAACLAVTGADDSGAEAWADAEEEFRTESDCDEGHKEYYDDKEWSQGCGYT